NAVKHRMHLASALRARSPDAGRLARALDTLAELLGEDHDLALLAGHIAGPARVAFAPHERVAGQAAIRREQGRGRRSARRLGAVLYRVRPAAVAKAALR